jgi:hypothetical protein
VTDIVAVVKKHRLSGLLIDSNLLLLLLVGRINRKRITAFKRTQKYTLGDFERLSQICAFFSRHWTTPQILTEVSNLSGQLTEPERGKFRAALASLVEVIDERYITSRLITSHSSFARLGITDAGLVLLSADGPLLLTDDWPLYETVARRGVDVINFNHVRMSNWR